MECEAAGAQWLTAQTLQLEYLGSNTVWLWDPPFNFSLEILDFGRPKQVDHLRLGIHNQPGQHDKTLSLIKIEKN